METTFLMYQSPSAVSKVSAGGFWIAAGRFIPANIQSHFPQSVSPINAEPKFRRAPSGWARAVLYVTRRAHLDQGALRVQSGSYEGAAFDRSHGQSRTGFFLAFGVISAVNFRLRRARRVRGRAGSAGADIRPVVLCGERGGPCTGCASLQPAEPR